MRFAHKLVDSGSMEVRDVAFDDEPLELMYPWQADFRMAHHLITMGRLSSKGLCSLMNP